jgi:hypothetical protein
MVADDVASGGLARFVSSAFAGDAAKRTIKGQKGSTLIILKVGSFQAGDREKVVRLREREPSLSRFLPCCAAENQELSRPKNSLDHGRAAAG